MFLVHFSSRSSPELDIQLFSYQLFQVSFFISFSLGFYSHFSRENGLQNSMYRRPADSLAFAFAFHFAESKMSIPAQVPDFCYIPVSHSPKCTVLNIDLRAYGSIEMKAYLGDTLRPYQNWSYAQQFSRSTHIIRSIFANR
jgi:hypothetical protein